MVGVLIIFEIQMLINNGMKGETNLSQLVKNLSPILNEGEYVFCSVKDISKIDRNITVCEFKEKEGITIVLEQRKADDLNLHYSYVASWITLNVHSSLNAVGLTAIVSKELTKHNISCNIIAGYYHDHIFVDTINSSKALNILIELTKK